MGIPVKNNKMTAYLVFLIVTWGFSWPVMKVGLDYAPPVLFAGLRTMIGGLTLITIAVIQARKLHFKKLWPIYIISTIFNVIFFFGLQTVALNYLPSGLLAVLVYCEPIMVGLLAWLWLGEQLTVLKVIGLILGSLGVAAISMKGLVGNISLFGVVLGFLSAVSWAIGTVYWKKVQGQADVLWLVALPLLLGGCVLSGAGTLMESWASIHLTGGFFASLAYASFIATGVSWAVWLQLVHMGEVSKIASYTFFVPLLSVIIGSVWLHEKVGILLVVGLVAIVCGIYLVNRPHKSVARA